ncbi:GT2 family glycosyltransferase [Kineothrix alysoides]|uniref:GT2 family glycosyltransferase n=1 Tax=Kineothrix alysoides TaxID=1469948 RepID=A0A4R1R1Z2_9FIRM|nr:glycosyltransferase family 2 protein [Kineothrix alysoides]TCL59376.1 GT2 family glycosyltransferase [Kineothrix alysoides]
MKLLGEIKSLLKIIKPHRIINAISIFKEQGWNGVKYHFWLVKDKERGLKEKKGRIYDVEPLYEYLSLEQYEPIVFSTYTNPLVSIIIPVYNQFAYTYNCLRAIKKYSEGVDYEIIIADDSSTDLTSELEKNTKGIKVIHNKSNYQFLINCNCAVKEAKGKYLVFLNNDTQVQKHWLKSLVDLLQTEERVGLAGSKLVYPTGLVQEAGGIVWRDATVLQYGNNRQAGEEELNYLRETDYVSGASIIIRKKLWEEIGGFDERFAPAYYEDVDLAFEVREQGYKVVYQPESEVVHFEGMSSKLENEQIRGIEKNRKLFLEKWEDVLKKRYFRAEDYRKRIAAMRKYRTAEENR